MAILGLIFLAIMLAVVLQRAISKPPLERERPPIVPLQQSMPSMSVYPSSDTYMVSLLRFIKRFVLMGTWPGSHISNHSNRSMSVLRVPSQSQLSRVYSQNSLHRSVSQLIDIHDKKSLIEDTVWETIVQGHDSGMFVEDEDFIDSIKGFSTVRKEHTMFTDTHL
ncbi:usherin [Acipenser oxyrinchus oxyrinchus]|uniref:Usherin n=1 Tax=Acipenser oxyrinchus oxyrinchus TaxID=40147 RepID=A0AAD8GBU5_ACIOX|nr:usherin [Acipenser oxyrinchus oxyrinchus]